MRILHPTDFSQPALQALGIARDLHKRLGGSLHIVHAQRRFESDQSRMRPKLDTFNPEMLNQLEEQRQAEVERLRGMLSHLASPDASYELLWGNPVEELLRIQSEYDLVVMGAHGANRFDNIFLGGVAGRFVRRGRVPIITIREESTVTEVRRVLVATDFGESSKAAWQFAQKLAAAGVELLLTHVVDDVRQTDDQDYLQSATDTLSSISAGLAQRIMVEEGNPAVVLPRLANEVGADLIVIGLRQHPAALGLLLGSRADALIRSSDVPVLAVPLTEE